jgi:hypothetical protein
VAVALELRVFARGGSGGVPAAALLLAADLPNCALKRNRAETSAETANGTGESSETGTRQRPLYGLRSVARNPGFRVVQPQLDVRGIRLPCRAVRQIAPGMMWNA